MKKGGSPDEFRSDGRAENAPGYGEEIRRKGDAADPQGI